MRKEREMNRKEIRKSLKMNDYEAYVYEITVNDTGKKYIGYHKGKFDGTY